MLEVLASSAWRPGAHWPSTLSSRSPVQLITALFCGGPDPGLPPGPPPGFASCGTEYTGTTVAPRKALSSPRSFAARAGGRPSRLILWRCAESAAWPPPGKAPGPPPGAWPVQLTLLPQTGVATKASSSTLLIALALGVAVIDSMAGSSPAAAVGVTSL